MHIDKVKIYARRFEIFCYFLFTLTPLSYVYAGIAYWFEFPSPSPIIQFSLMHKCLMLAAMAMSLFVYTYFFLLCIRLARLFQTEQVFSESTSRLLSHVSRMAIVLGVYEMALGFGCYKIGMLYTPTLLTEAQVLSLSLSFGMSGWIGLLLFGVLSFLASVVSKATDIKHDQDLTI